MKTPRARMITARITYTDPADHGIQLELPIYPCPDDAWRAGVPA